MIVVSGVRSSCAALETNSRSASSRRSCSVRSSTTSRAQSVSGLGVREVDDEILVDREHALVQPLQQQAEPVALGLEAPERAAQLAAHPVEVEREQSELVAEAVVERRLEVAVGDRLGGRAQPPQP
jgi:hypothetical protein